MQNTFKCKICGGDLEVVEGQKICECEYCGTMQTISNLRDEKLKNLYERGHEMMRNFRFDEAVSKFEKILEDNTEDPEVYWGLCLARFGITYVDDPYSGKKIPTIHRTQEQSIFADADYQKACSLADNDQRSYYEKEAKLIDNIQKKYERIIENEKPYDVFICYKQTDDETKKDTEDYKIAYSLFSMLEKKGYHVFFSHVSLEDKFGEEYEPYIYAALRSARLMLCVGTRSEYYDAVWVKNEWRRFLFFSAKEPGRKLIPVCSDSSVLPPELSRFQAVEIEKSIVWKEDLERSVDKILISEKTKETKADVKKQVKQAPVFEKPVEKPASPVKESKKSNTLLIVVALALIVGIAAFVLVPILTKPSEYDLAVQAFNEGDYASAYAYFSNNQDVKDSSSYLNSEEMMNWEFDCQIKDLKTNDKIILGNYNGDVEWTVVSSDNDKVVLLSTKILDYTDFGTSADWGDSSIRKWLNSDFLNGCVPGNVRDRLVKTSQGDYVFIPSLNEFDSLPSSSKTAYSTDYALDVGSGINQFDEGCYWLRNEGTTKGAIITVAKNGSVDKNGSYPKYANGIRPMIVLKRDLKSSGVQYSTSQESLYVAPKIIYYVTVIDDDMTVYNKPSGADDGKVGKVYYGERWPVYEHIVDGQGLDWYRIGENQWIRDYMAQRLTINY